MVWPEEIQQKYEDELNTIAYGMIKVIHPGYQNRITELIYKTNDELNELMNNPEGTKQDYLDRIEKVKSELSSLIEQDNKIVEDNQNIDVEHQKKIEVELKKIKETDGVKWDAVRNTRNYLLSQCDWTQLPDNPLSDVNRKMWAEYRIFLRNITDQFKTVKSIKWPAKPE